MALATFAWTWVTTASPAWLLPLASRAASSWAWSVDRRMGLFAGQWRHAKGTGVEAGAEAEADLEADSEAGGWSEWLR